MSPVCKGHVWVIKLGYHTFLCAILWAVCRKYFWVFCFGIFNCQRNHKWKPTSNELYKHFHRAFLTFSLHLEACAVVLATFSPSMDVPLGCSTWNSSIFRDSGSFTPNQTRGYDRATCFHLQSVILCHILPINVRSSTWVFHSFWGQWVFYPGPGKGSHIQGRVMGPLGANSCWCNSYRSTMQPLGPRPQCNALTPSSVPQLHREGK